MAAGRRSLASQSVLVRRAMSPRGTSAAAVAVGSSSKRRRTAEKKIDDGMGSFMANNVDTDIEYINQQIATRRELAGRLPA